MTERILKYYETVLLIRTTQLAFEHFDRSLWNFEYEIRNRQELIKQGKLFRTMHFAIVETMLHELSGNLDSDVG